MFADLYLAVSTPAHKQAALDGCKKILARRGKDGLWGDRETNVICLAALRAAQMATIDVPGVDALKVNKAFFDQVDHPDFRDKADTPMEWVLGTLARHHAGGRAWSTWQERMARELVKLQKESGSWGEDPYVTALAAIIAHRILN